MKWPFTLHKKTQTGNQELIDRYKHWRALCLELNMTLAKQLPKAAVPECGKKLGIFKAGTLILNNDDEIAILYDYCLYHYRRGGKNTIERYLDNSPPAAESTKMEILRAMLASYYSIFKLVDIHPKQGASLQDLLSNKVVNLIDLGLSDTGYPGLLLAGRILPFADFHISSGTFIPLTQPVFEDRIIPIIRKFFKTYEPGNMPYLSPSQIASFTSEIIRVCLHAGGSDNVFYTDVEQ
jgi:hypothetical protein